MTHVVRYLVIYPVIARRHKTIPPHREEPKGLVAIPPALTKLVHCQRSEAIPFEGTEEGRKEIASEFIESWQ